MSDFAVLQSIVDADCNVFCIKSQGIVKYCRGKGL